MTKKRLLMIGLTVLAMSMAASAFAFGSKGTSGATFLKIGPGARPAGMGEAFSAVSDDLHAIYYNPAGLAGLKSWEVSGMYNQYFQGLDYSFFGMASPVQRLRRFRPRPNDVSPLRPERDLGTIGFAVYTLSADGLERRGTTDSGEPEGTFGAKDTALSLAYAKRLGTRLSLGGSFKLIHQTIDTSQATAYAADIGSLYRSHEHWRVSAGIKNLGTRQKFVNESDPLPLTGYLGTSYRPRKSLALGLDLGFPRDRSATVAVGGELTRKLTGDVRGAIRGGYFTRNTDAEGMNGISLGFGVGYGRIDFDFAWVPFGDLGNTFRYSLLIRF